MRQKVKEKSDESLSEDQCHHYWIIEIANGPKSKGVCKYCGETRHFLNAMPDFNTLKRSKNPLELPEMPVVLQDLISLSSSTSGISGSSSGFLLRFSVLKSGIAFRKCLVSPQYLQTPLLLGPLAISIIQ